MPASQDNPYYRGEGIWVRGDLRLRNLTLSFDMTTGDLVSPPPTVEVRTHAWADWLVACREACDDCSAARESTKGADDDDFAISVESEFRRGMQAVTAAAFAIDAFYGSVVEHAPELRVRAKSRAKSIAATFGRGFVLTNAQQREASKLVVQVFRFRDRAVHPRAEFVAPVRHPTFGLGMDPRFVIFRLENANASRIGVHRLLWLLLHRPRGRYASLVEWATASKALVEAPPDPE
jgi:hypothetical protein